jgi:hypothetical protein
VGARRARWGRRAWGGKLGDAGRRERRQPSKQALNTWAHPRLTLSCSARPDPLPPTPTNTLRYPGRDKQALFFSHYLGPPGAPAALSEAQLDALCAEADVFALASHIYWGIWAVVQARYSPIDFDYMGYHHLRFGEYRRRKAEFMGRAAEVFGGAPAAGGGKRGKAKKAAATGAEAAAVDKAPQPALAAA